jgi:uncharacterized repeat protein (TIGR03803 family)
MALAGLTLAAPSLAATRKVLHAFTGSPDGLAPESDLIMDAHGNLYGTTYAGGTGACEYGCGTVFELSPNSTGGYTEHILHSFEGPLMDGQQPMAPLTFDAQGNLYGTTLSGGQSVTAASGTVFKLAPNADGTWTETILHSFNGGLLGGTDGGEPQAGLVFDTAGNLYGTTAGGGTGIGCAGGNGCGTVFELTPLASGGWGETILHNFTNDHQDGWNPYAKLIMDRLGNLYGTTFVGGAAGGGTVFRLSRTEDGWQESILYSFSCGADGCSPYSGVVFDAAGNLYGTTVGGGNESGDGVVYKLSRNAAGEWVQTVLHAFMGGGDGSYAYGNPILDASGNVYGTTLDGGGDNGTCPAGCGILYKLAPGAGGGFTESVPAHFGNGEGGSGPLTGLLMDGSGNLYGTAAFSGPHGDGAVFEVVP